MYKSISGNGCPVLDMETGHSSEYISSLAGLCSLSGRSGDGRAGHLPAPVTAVRSP